MKKKKVLVTYDEMIVGGSTTSLLAFLNCIDKEKYDVELQLYRNKGPLMDDIPKGVRLLPEAEMYNGRLGKIIKLAKLIFSGAVFKVMLHNKQYKTNLLFGRALIEYQAKFFSRKNKGHYDYAIGYLEGWPDKYIAYCIDADVKYCWLHSTFSKMAPIPAYEIPWIKKADKVVFVADNCKEEFCKMMPQYADKAITVRNITDSSIIRKRAEHSDELDEEYLRFKNAACFKIITVARIEISIKGLDRTIKCAKKMKESGRDFLWTVIGDGPDLNKFKRMIQDEDLGDCVKAIGKRINPCPFVKEADVFCMLSRYEGMPMSVTESMILGVPPVVTRYNSANEQINNGIDGIIVENSDESAFDVLCNCIDNPEAVRKMKDYLLDREYGNPEYMREIENSYLK